MKIKYLHLLILFFLFSACIDPYEVNFSGKNKILVVEGLLTDDTQNPDTLKLQYSNYTDGYVEVTPITSVKATIFIEETGIFINLIEQPSGGYLPPSDFKMKPTETYTLKFTLPNGQQYESTPQSVTPTPPILNIYEKFNPTSRLSEDGKSQKSASEVFIDFQDTPHERNFYLWRYTEYERLTYCASCNNSTYSTFTESCSGPGFPFFQEPYYDYRCLNECYAILRGTQINIFSDISIDGRVFSGRLVAKIPFFEVAGCLVEVQQLCVSSEVYSFYKKLLTQTQSTGSLADTPPEAIVGNIHNHLDPTEKVIGCFGVSNLQKRKFWIDRKDATGKRDLILGHEIIELTPPSFARCKKSSTRTPFKPEGWQ